jgi:hypothetical protein
VDAHRPDTQIEPHGDTPEKEYVGYISIGDEPGERLSVWARSADEAGRNVVAEYGKGHAYSIWNEDDAQKPR